MTPADPTLATHPPQAARLTSPWVAQEPTAPGHLYGEMNRVRNQWGGSLSGSDWRVSRKRDAPEMPKAPSLGTRGERRGRLFFPRKKQATRPESRRGVRETSRDFTRGAAESGSGNRRGLLLGARHPLPI